jgi:transposase
MPDPHPQELRERAVRSYEDGVDGYLTVADRFSISVASLKRWVYLNRREGTLEPRPKGGGTPSAITAAEIETLIEDLRDPTAGELTAAFNRSRRGRHRVHVSSMKRALRRCGYVVKKSADGRWRVCVPTSSKPAPRS